RQGPLVSGPGPAREWGVASIAVPTGPGQIRNRTRERGSPTRRLSNGHLERTGQRLLARLISARRSRSRAASELAPLEATIPSESCPECRAPVGGRDACQRLFDALGLRAFDEPRSAAMRRLAVDCYACQHDRYILSGRSLAAHL